MTNTSIVGVDCCKKCKFCKGVVEQGPSGPENKIACFRNPPQIVVIHSQKGVMVRASNPLVNPDNWCGEFIPRIMH